MAYVDIERPNADFRFVPDRHSIAVNPSQLHPNHSCVAIETMRIDVKGEYQSLTEDQALVWGKADTLKAVREKTLADGVPYATFHPMFTPGGLLRLYEQTQNRETPEYPLKVYERIRFLTEIVKYDGLIKSTDPIVDKSIESAEEITNVEERQIVDLTNLIVAEKGEAFADFQIREDHALRPQIDIIAGAAHMGIVRALEMEKDVRRSRILQHPILQRYFAIDQLSTGYYVQLNPITQQLEKKTFDIPSLQLN